MDTSSFTTTCALCGMFATAYLMDCPDSDRIVVSYVEGTWKAHHAPTDTT